MTKPGVSVSYEHEAKEAVVIAVEGDWMLEYMTINSDGKTYLTLRPKLWDCSSRLVGLDRHTTHSRVYNAGGASRGARSRPDRKSVV